MTNKFLGENGVQELVSLIKDTDLKKIKETFTGSYIIDKLSYWFDTNNCDVVPTPGGGDEPGEPGVGG